MPKGSAALTQARKEEIIQACSQLYAHKNFKEITMKDIADATSFTRTSIYNYFQTKEEIFLALLQQEYALWIKDLQMLQRENSSMTVEEFACAMAASLDKRHQLLKIIAMNHYDMEASSRMENLISFKQTYSKTIQAVSDCLKKFFSMTEREIHEFLYVFFPFLFGVYPYAFATEKQKQAMAQAQFDHPQLTVYDLVHACVQKLLIAAAEK